MATSILQDVLIGLTFGMLYFLMAAGLTLTMGVLGIANFAHGAMFMVGAYVAWTVSQVLHGSGSAFWISLPSRRSSRGSPCSGNGGFSLEARL